MLKIFFITVLSFNLYALEIDEVLSVRLLKVSSSKKTVLINRGIEDGLVEGDHAKFFVTEGVIARGIAVKLTPSRSIWSIYRLVNPNYIATESLMKIKITEAVQISNDQSKQIIKADQPALISRRQRNSSSGSRDQTEEQDFEAQSDDDLELAEVTRGRSHQTHNHNGKNNLSRNIEIWSAINFSVANSEVNTGSATITGSGNQFQFKLGGELYAKTASKWYSNFSISPFIALSGNSILAFEGSEASTSRVEYGGLLNWHPLKNKAWHIHKFIPFLSLGFALGTVSGDVNTDSSSESLSGTSTRLSFGGGFKYYALSGFGVRMNLDFFNLSDTYEEDAANNITDVSSSGPRLFVGASYRW